MVVAPDDVGDAHVVIVDDHGQIIGRRAVRTQQHQIVEIGIGPGHRALDRVVNRHRTGQGAAEAHDVRLGRIAFRRIAVAPRGLERAALGLGRVAQGPGLLGRGPVAVGVAGGDHLRHDLAVTVGTGELEDRLLVREQAQPAEAVEDRLHGPLGRTLAVSVLHTDKEFPAATFRV